MRSYLTFPLLILALACAGCVQTPVADTQTNSDQQNPPPGLTPSPQDFSGNHTACHAINVDGTYTFKPSIPDLDLCRLAWGFATDMQRYDVRLQGTMFADWQVSGVPLTVLQSGGDTVPPLNTVQSVELTYPDLQCGLIYNATDGLVFFIVNVGADTSLNQYTGVWLVSPGTTPFTAPAPTANG